MYNKYRITTYFIFVQKVYNIVMQRFPDLNLSAHCNLCILPIFCQNTTRVIIKKNKNKPGTQLVCIQL